jgi:hypothetical protein
VSEANPDEIIAGWNDWRRSTGQEIINAAFSLSLDGGQTWEDFLVRPPAGFQTNVEGDPMTAFDDRTGVIWAGAIAFGGSHLYSARKDPGNDAFEDSVVSLSGSLDKNWMAAGPRPNMPDTTRAYVALNVGVLFSDDLGDTWSSPRSLGGGIGFLPRVASDGTLYVSWQTGSLLRIARSDDGGLTFSTFTIATRLDTWGTQDGSRFPGNFRVPPWGTIDVDYDDPDTVYCAYFDTTNIVNGQRNVDNYFTVSHDRGVTWSTPVVVNGDSDPPGDQFFTWIEADKDGYLHLIYNDGRNTVQNDNITNGMFDTYYAFSRDGGDTWCEFRLTPSPWNCNDDGLNRGQQFIGDYLGLSVAGRKAYPAYLDTSNGDPDIFVNVIQLPAPGDVDVDGDADFDDVLLLLGVWGTCGEGDPCDGACPADLNGDGFVGFGDLLIVLSNWTEP